MIEALVSISLAAIAGGAALNTRLHNRINSVHERISALDRRLDNIELTVASDYVKKKELSELLSRMEDHMVRIENKLDQIVLRNG
jgi:bacterioferritin (cytochrome b1)